MLKPVKEISARVIFSLFFVYVLFLGIFNLLVIFNKSKIEHMLASMLEADKVSIGHISNLPLFFISGTDFTIQVNEELYLKLEGVYFYYSIIPLFNKKYPQSIKNIEIDLLEFYGHRQELSSYISKLKKKFSTNSETIRPDMDINSLIRQLRVDFKIRYTKFTLNAMTEFWYTLSLNNSSVNIANNQLQWNSGVRFNGIWSNEVFIADTVLSTKGTIKDLLSSNTVDFDLDIQSMNFLGIPLINTNLLINTKIVEGDPVITVTDVLGQNNITVNTGESFSLNLNKNFNIAYEEYEEYEVLDYVFKPGLWNLNLTINQKPDWGVDIKLTSPQYPDYGLVIQTNPIQKNKLYKVFLKLKTHYFGSIDGDLLLPIRKGLYPLPYGSLTLDNVRFILNGLIFSGNAVVDLVPGKNEFEITAFDVRMNNGLIGNTSVNMSIVPGDFTVTPKYMENAAIEVFVKIKRKVIVQLKALDVDGDFVAQNIKIPIFGIKESRYRGFIDMYTKDRKSPFLLNGYLKGYLDGEEQVDALISLEDTNIDVKKFHIINPDILLDGRVIINPFKSNTFIDITGQGSFNGNNTMPIQIGVNIGRNKAEVNGTVDDTVKVNSITTNNDTLFNVSFSEYSLQKLGVLGDLTANLIMNFTEQGVSRFAIQDGQWNIKNRKFTMNFDSLRDTNSTFLDIKDMKLGLDNVILEGFGYFAFDDGFAGAMSFLDGGSFQFNIGRYIVKSSVNLYKFEIDNLFNEQLLEPLSFLSNDSTDTMLASIDMSIEGMWSDLNYKGSVKLEGKDSDDFQFIVPKLSVSDKIISITNLRLRHPRLNLDTDLVLNNIEKGFNINMSGAVALDGLVKSNYEIDYSQHDGQGLLTYLIPNFYLFSTKPVKLQGKIIHDTHQFLFTSDQLKQGFQGVVIRTNQDIVWDVNLLNNSMSLISEGSVINNNVSAFLDWDIFLDQLFLSGDFRKMRGFFSMNATVDGSIDDPIVNGKLSSKNIELSLRSLRNKLRILNNPTIFISNNQVIIPPITIDSESGGKLNVEGLLLFQDQTLETVDLKLYTTPTENEVSYLNWNLNVPLFSIKGKTYIKNIDITGSLDNLSLLANIDAESLNLGLELDGALGADNLSDVNPFLAILSSMNLDITLNMRNRSRLYNQLFNMEFEQNNPITAQGGIGDNTLTINGYFDVVKGKVNYVNTDLDIQSGTIQFSGEEDDIYPYVSVKTDTKRNFQNDTIDIYVDFEGKLPNFELVNISSSAGNSKAELFNILGIGTTSMDISQSASVQDILASGVGIAENAFFTAPLSRKIRQLIPFDTFQIQTDILGNLTRSVNSSSGDIPTGISILHGSELEIGQYIPKLRGVQFKYSLRLESPDNSSINTDSLNQIHKVGAEWSRILPYSWRIGIGGNVVGEVKPNEIQAPLPEFVGEISVKKRF